MKTNKQTFAKNLKMLLIEDEIKAFDLSKKIRVAPKVISNWLNEVNLPKLNNAIILTNYFKTSIDYIFGLSFERDFIPKNNSLTFYKNFIKIIRYEEIAKKEIAEECGFASSVFKRWDKGELPHLDNLISLSEYLELPIEYIIGRTDKTSL